MSCRSGERARASRIGGVTKNCHMEKLTTYIVKRIDNGQLDCLQIRGLAIDNWHCNAGHASEIGERIFWHRCDFNMTRVEGVIVARMSENWNWAAPVGQRSENAIYSEEFKALRKAYRNQKQLAVS